MAEDNKNAFDYYVAEPPKESTALPPEDAAASAPEDEYNENVHGTDNVRRVSGSVRSVALALTVGTLVLSFMISSGNPFTNPDVIPTATVTEASASGNGKATESVTETTPTPTPTPSPTPTPVPIATEDLRVKIDSLEMYALEKGFLAEVKFTMATNCGTEVTSITGALDSNIFVYDGYNFKKNKMKYHYEKFHQDFSLDPSAVPAVEGIQPTEKQYTILVNLSKDLTSEDKFSVTLTVSNTLNGEKTKDKTVTLNDVEIWNNDTDSYGTMYNISVTKNADKSFDVTITPKFDDVPIGDIRVEGVSAYAKKGSAYLTAKDFTVTKDGNKFHIEFKNPKKAPSKGRLSFTTFAKFERTDSAGTKFTGSAYGHKSIDY